ncbi:MAG TPA: transcription antitermination factor NusB [Alphaproteobacteria bacterium]|nr:transcription antitermination factor NusB [Alphaproteobacteria bacterium]
MARAATVARKPNARNIALDLLGEVLTRRRALDEAIEREPKLLRLEARDRAFARLLVATTLRRLGQIDALVDGRLAKKLPAKAARVRDILRLGVAQLLFLHTPAHAAVGETVELASGAELAGFKGLVNALLRRLATDGEAALAAQDAPRLDTPGWLWRGWCDTYGENVARAIAANHFAEPPLDLSVKHDAALWAERLGAALLPTGSLRLAHMSDVRALPGFSEGAWWVQDAAASLPVRLLGDVRGKRVVDLCAAPGGKTAQLAAAGAQVVAVERSGPRLERVRDNLARLGLEATLVAADAERWRPETPADAVLLDAPCTATGTIRRHPDIAYLKSPADVTRMTATQAKLLAAAAEMVRPGGFLVYATCSLERAEGEAQIERFLDSGAPFERLPIHARELAAEDAPAPLEACRDLVSEKGDLRTLPSHWPELGGLDGFFAARLIRR